MLEKARRNSNCLEGMQCPKCGSLEPFAIEVSTVTLMYDDGSDGCRDMDFGDGSYCRCNMCDFEGVVENFHTNKE